LAWLNATRVTVRCQAKFDTVLPALGIQRSSELRPVHGPLGRAAARGVSPNGNEKRLFRGKRDFIFAARGIWW